MFKTKKRTLVIASAIAAALIGVLVVLVPALIAKPTPEAQMAAYFSAISNRDGTAAAEALGMEVEDTAATRLESARAVPEVIAVTRSEPDGEGNVAVRVEYVLAPSAATSDEFYFEAEEDGGWQISVSPMSEIKVEEPWGRPLTLGGERFDGVANVFPGSYELAAAATSFVQAATTTVEVYAHSSVVSYIDATPTEELSPTTEDAIGHFIETCAEDPLRGCLKDTVSRSLLCFGETGGCWRDVSITIDTPFTVASIELVDDGYTPAAAYVKASGSLTVAGTNINNNTDRVDTVEVHDAYFYFSINSEPVVLVKSPFES